jgi:hypothetical protein
MDAELFGPKKITPRTTPRKSSTLPARKPPVADSKANDGNDDWLFGGSTPSAKPKQDQFSLSSAKASDSSGIGKHM